MLAKVSGKNILRDIEEEKQELLTNPNLDWLIKDRILKGFKETTYKDPKGKARTVYQLSEEAFLQMSLRYSSEVRARFVVAFTSYRDTIINLYKARVLEKVVPLDLLSILLEKKVKEDLKLFRQAVLKI